MQPIRVTKKEACTLLAMSASAIERLIKTDPTFPRPIKHGTTRQASVYFDYADLVEWHRQQVDSITGQEVSA